MFWSLRRRREWPGDGLTGELGVTRAHVLIVEDDALLDLNLRRHFGRADFPVVGPVGLLSGLSGTLAFAVRPDEAGDATGSAACGCGHHRAPQAIGRMYRLIGPKSDLTFRISA